VPTRVISDNLLSSKKVNQLKPNEFEFYIRLLLCVDDYGFYSADPVEVVRSAYPKKEMLSKEILPVLDRLEELGLIVRYAVWAKVTLDKQCSAHPHSCLNIQGIVLRHSATFTKFTHLLSPPLLVLLAL